MYDPFDRRLSVGADALVKGRIKNSKLMIDVEKKLDLIIRNHNYFYECPFLWVGLGYRYGIKHNLKLEFQRIDKKWGYLPIALELDMEILKWADQNNLDLLHDIYMIAALEALIQVGQKYKLSTAVFEDERAKYNNIPNTIQECETYTRLMP